MPNPSTSQSSGPDGASARATVRRVAALARLELDENRTAELARDFANILEAFGALAEADVDGIQGMQRVGEEVSVTRDDQPRPSLPVEEALGGAPDRREDFYSVPRTVGGPS